jgi:nucleoid-associated protein YgaU
MRRRAQQALWLAGLTLAAGCRTAVKVAQVPRVDLDLHGGNRGYLIGTPPPSEAPSATRQLVETTIELPSFAHPTGRAGDAIPLEDISPPEREAPPSPGKGPAAAQPASPVADGRLAPPLQAPASDRLAQPPRTTPAQDRLAHPPLEPSEIYVVQPGDSLWTIAAKPEVYGDATRWRRIFEANRDQLAAPDEVRAGMSLKIPRGPHGPDTDIEDALTARK